jgi:hypothetical protein
MVLSGLAAASGLLVPPPAYPEEQMAGMQIIEM